MSTNDFGRGTEEKHQRDENQRQTQKAKEHASLRPTMRCDEHSI